jgi:hypothetical protein
MRHREVYRALPHTQLLHQNSTSNYYFRNEHCSTIQRQEPLKISSRSSHILTSNTTIRHIIMCLHSRNKYTCGCLSEHAMTFNCNAINRGEQCENLAKGKKQYKDHIAPMKGPCFRHPDAETATANKDTEGAAKGN